MPAVNVENLPNKSIDSTNVLHDNSIVTNFW